LSESSPNNEEPTFYRWTFGVHFKLGRGDDDLSNVLVEMMCKRYSVYYTVEGFERARRAAAKVGIVLNDIERWPIVEPEFVPMIVEECLMDEPNEYELAEIHDTNYLKESDMEYDWRDYRRTGHIHNHEDFM
jgi:hypothetical protein